MCRRKEKQIPFTHYRILPFRVLKLIESKGVIFWYITNYKYCLTSICCEVRLKSIQSCLDSIWSLSKRCLPIVPEEEQVFPNQFKDPFNPQPKGKILIIQVFLKSRKDKKLRWQKLPTDLASIISRVLDFNLIFTSCHLLDVFTFVCCTHFSEYLK